MRWPEAPLGNCASRFISGGTPSTTVSEYWNGEIPWITGADFREDGLNLGRRYVTEKAIAETATNIVPAGALLIVTRTGVGKIDVAPVDVAISQDITGIVLTPDLDAYFCKAAVRQRMPRLLAVQRGAIIKGITRRDLRELPVPRPPIREQRRIVAILDQADALRRKRAEADARAADILPALFYKMFGDPVTNPMGWPKKPLSALIKIGTKLVDPEDPEYHDHVHIGGEHIERDTGRILPSLTVRESHLKSAKYLFDETHVLYSKIRPYLNKVAFPRFAGLCSADIYPLQLKSSEISQWYLVGLLRSPAFLDYTKSHSERLRMPKLNREQLGAFLVPVPDREKLFAYNRTVEVLLKLDHKRSQAHIQINSIYEVLLNRSFANRGCKMEDRNVSGEKSSPAYDENAPDGSF